MIIFGTRANEITQEKLTTACLNCKESTLIASYWQRLFHIFWVPIIPLYKFSQVLCPNCGTLYDGDHLQPSLASEVEKSKPSTPKWAFSGLFIIGFLIIGGIVSGHIDKKNINELIANPQPNDLYLIHTTDGEHRGYAFIKLEEIKNGEYIFTNGKFLYGTTHGAEKELNNVRDNPHDNFAQSSISLTLEDVKLWEIKKIYRKKS